MSSSGSGSETNSNSTTSGQNQPAQGGDASKSSNTEQHSTTTNKSSTETKTENNTTNVNISVEQQTEIRQVVKEVHVERVKETNFEVAVGTNIPRHIDLEPLPSRIVEVVPQYKAYRFFILADGRVVIVDPDDFTIVYILTA